MNPRLKKSIFLGVLTFCLVNMSHGVLVEEGGRRSVSPSHAPYLVDDAMDPRGADYSGTSMSEAESDWEDQNSKRPGMLGDAIFAKFGAKKVFRKHRQMEDLEKDKKSPPVGIIGNVRMDEATRETLRDHIEEVVAYINNRRWGNSVKGQQAKYDAFVKQLTEDDLSEPELERLKGLTPEEREKARLILEELGLSSGIDSGTEDVSQPEKKVSQSLTQEREESKEEESQKTIQSLDKETIHAFSSHVKRIAKEVGALNWFTSPKEQQNKFEALVTRLRTTFSPLK